MKFFTSELLKKSNQYFTQACQSDWQDEQQAANAIIQIETSIRLLKFLEMRSQSLNHIIAYRYHKLGHLYFEIGNYERSILMFGKAIAMNDSYDGWNEHYQVHKAQALNALGLNRVEVKSILSDIQSSLFTMILDAKHVKTARKVWWKLSNNIPPLNSIAKI